MTKSNMIEIMKSELKELEQKERKAFDVLVTFYPDCFEKLKTSGDIVFKLEHRESEIIKSLIQDMKKSFEMEQWNQAYSNYYTVRTMLEKMGI